MCKQHIWCTGKYSSGDVERRSPLAWIAWRIVSRGGGRHRSASDLTSEQIRQIFKGAEREDRVLNIRRGGSVLKKPKVAPTDNHLTNGLRTSDFRTAIIGVTDLWALQLGFPFPRPSSPSQLLIRRPSFA